MSDQVNDIRSILIQIGGDKLANEVITKIDARIKTIREEAVKQRDEEINKIKSALTDDLNDYKNKLSSKVRMFLETKQAKIEGQMAKNIALKESAAEIQLATAQKALGMRVANTDGTKDAEILALKQENLAKASQIKSFMESVNRKDKEIEKITQIAENAIQRNKNLNEALIQKTKAPDRVEPTEPKPKKIEESVSLQSPIPAPAAKSTTVRPQASHQVIKPKDAQDAQKPKAQSAQVNTIDNIANTME